MGSPRLSRKARGEFAPESDQAGGSKARRRPRSRTRSIGGFVKQSTQMRTSYGWCRKPCAPGTSGAVHAGRRWCGARWSKVVEWSPSATKAWEDVVRFRFSAYSLIHPAIGSLAVHTGPGSCGARMFKVVRGRLALVSRGQGRAVHAGRSGIQRDRIPTDQEPRLPRCPTPTPAASLSSRHTSQTRSGSHSS